MLNLAATTDKFQLTTSSAANIDVHASFVDLNGTTITPGKQNTAISSATTTDMVAAPASSTYRNVKTLTIRNKHASLSNTVTVIFDQNGTDYELHQATLRAGEMLSYTEGVGFYVNAATTPAGLILKALASDFTITSATPAEVTGLTVTTGTGSFQGRYAIIYQSTVTTTGIRLSLNHDGTVTEFVYHWYFTDTTATAATAAADQDAVGAAGQVFSVFAARAKSTAGAGTSISVDTANADMLLTVEFAFVCTVSGDLELWVGGENASATITVKDGSSLALLKAA